jgi:hypothetical protein
MTGQKGWPKTHEIWSRRAQQTTSTAMSTATTSVSSTSNPTSATVTSTKTPTPAQQGRLQRATDPDVMGENYFNRNRRSRRQVSTASVQVATSPKSTSSNSVQILQPPPPTIIDLTVESIEDLMMADVQEQKAASDNETSPPKGKSAKGKRKHVATGNPKGRPPRDPSKDGDRAKGQGLA